MILRLQTLQIALHVLLRENALQTPLLSKIDRHCPITNIKVVIMFSVSTCMFKADTINDNITEPVLGMSLMSHYDYLNHFPHPLL